MSGLSAPATLVDLEDYVARGLDPLFSREDPGTPPSPWLQGRIALAHDLDGTLRTCRHLKPGEPQRLVLWAGNRALCSACSTAAARAARGTPSEWACSVCGLLDVEGAPFITGRRGDLLVIVGTACRACLPIVHPGWGWAA